MLRRIGLIVGIIIFSFAYSADNDTSKIFIKEPGAKALEFGMSGLFNIRKGIGGSISYKSFQTSNSVNRIGVSFSGEFGMDFKNGEIISYPDSLEIGTTKTGKDYSLRNELVIVYQKINYLQPKNGIALYYGYGPKVGYTLYNVFDDQTVSNNTTYQRKRQRNRLYTGLSTVVGIEWFYNSNISLYAEYQNDAVLGVYHENIHTKKLYLDYTRTSVKNESIGPYLSFVKKVNSGVSFYFK